MTAQSALSVLTLFYKNSIRTIARNSDSVKINVQNDERYECVQEEGNQSEIWCYKEISRFKGRSRLAQFNILRYNAADMRDEYVNMSVNEQKRIREEVDIMKEFFTLCKKKEILMLKGGKVWNSLVRDCGTYECWNRCSCFVKPTALVQIRAAVSRV